MFIKNPEKKRNSSNNSQTLNVTTPSKCSKTKLTNVKWSNSNFSIPTKDVIFKNNINFPDEILSLDTPMKIFSYFFNDDLLEHICKESIRFSKQNDPNCQFNISNIGLKKYVGICILMSLVNISNCRKYWSPNLGNTIIQVTMSNNNFEKIRKYLHFNNNDNMIPRNSPGHDRLFKIRPLIDALNKKFSSIPLEENLAIDEQLCSTKARNYLKQYLPMKPHKWGYKLFVLSGVSGFSYNFEIYSGQENDETFRRPSEPDLGASANVVVRLSRVIPKNKNYKLYFDNYYTTLSLMTYLKTNKILSLRTVRRNRLQNVLLLEENVMKTLPRGSMSECVTKIQGTKIAAVSWNDNKVVTLLSTFVGVDPITVISRFSKKEKKMTYIDCPSVIKVYNKHMGGVDLLDSLLGRHKIKMRSRKWYMRLFYHLLDMTVVNSW